MQLFGAVMNDGAVTNLAQNGFFVEGENNKAWRAYSAVYMKQSVNPYRLRVSFAAN